MATCWDTEPRRAVGTELRPWDPTTTVPAILDASISVVAAKPVTLWEVVGSSGAVVWTRSMAAVRTGSLLAGASLVPSCCLSVSTGSVSRACTTCSGCRVRWASAIAQRRAESLEAEPSTPTTTLPSVIWWVLMLGSLGVTSCCLGHTSMAARGLCRIRRQSLGGRNLPSPWHPTVRRVSSTAYAQAMATATAETSGAPTAPAALVGSADLPERLGYRLKRRVLGPALTTDPARQRDVAQEAPPRRSLQGLLFGF